MATVPLTVIAQQLGHRDTRMVDKHYGHLAKKYVTDTIRNLSPKLNLTDVNLPAPSPPVAS
jgi:integrase